MIKSLDEQQYSTATIGAPLISSAKLQFFRDNAKHSNGYFGTSMGMLEKSRREKIFFRRDFLFSRLFFIQKSPTFFLLHIGLILYGTAHDTIPFMNE